jgi:hypothetical protein
VFLSYRALSGDAFHSVFGLRERTRAELFSDALQLHASELANLRSAGVQQLRGEPELVRWGRFLTAETDEELQALAQEELVMKQATAVLVRLSGDIDARELAKQRELALVTYHFELTAAREEGKAEGEASGGAEGRAAALGETARRLRATGMPREQVAALLGLKLEDVPDDEAWSDCRTTACCWSVTATACEPSRICSSLPAQAWCQCIARRTDRSTVETCSLSTCRPSVGGYAGVYDLSGNVYAWEDSCVTTPCPAGSRRSIRQSKRWQSTSRRTALGCPERPSASRRTALGCPERPSASRRTALGCPERPSASRRTALGCPERPSASRPTALPRVFWTAAS